MFKISEDIAISLHVASPHKKEKRKEKKSKHGYSNWINMLNHLLSPIIISLKKKSYNY